MVMAADLSMRLGLIDAALRCSAWRAVERAGLLVVGARASGANRYLELMRVDKKAEGRRDPLRRHRGAGRGGAPRRP